MYRYVYVFGIASESAFSAKSFFEKRLFNVFQVASFHGKRSVDPWS